MTRNSSLAKAETHNTAFKILVERKLCLLMRQALSASGGCSSFVASVSSRAQKRRGIYVLSKEYTANLKIAVWNITCTGPSKGLIQGHPLNEAMASCLQVFRVLLLNSNRSRSAQCGLSTRQKAGPLQGQAEVMMTSLQSLITLYL